jgi:hypothetical protein
MYMANSMIISAFPKTLVRHWNPSTAHTGAATPEWLEATE